MPEHVALLVDFTSHIHGVAEKNLSLLRAKSTINLDSRQSETASIVSASTETTACLPELRLLSSWWWWCRILVIII